MNIVVCVKRVPATDTQIRVGPDGRSIDPAGVEYVLNPYDEFAVEEALRTKEKVQDATVTVVTLGSSAAQKELRTCLAMGADRAVLLKSEEDHDAYSTAEILARYLRGRNPDLVFTGKQAVDSDNNQTAQRIATLLGIGCVTEAVAFELEDGAFTVQRDVEGGREVVRGSLPAVISAQKGLNEPRYASLKGIMAAKKKPLEEVEAEKVEPATTVVSLTLPPERPPGRILGEGHDAVGALIEVLRNEVKVF